MKIVLVGYDQMLANLIMGVIDANATIVGVLRNEKIKYNHFLLKIKDFFAPSKDYSLIKSLKLFDINAKSVNSEEFKKFLIKNNIDIVLVGSWSEKFKKEIISTPKIATINAHPSLLPRFRGPNPYAQVIMAKEKKTGITFHLMDENFDTGAILHQLEIPIFKHDTGITLKERTTKAARKGIFDLLNMFKNEMVIPVSQTEQNASYQSQLTAHDILISFKSSAEDIDHKIRGLTPWMKVYFSHANEFFKIDKFKILNSDKKYEPKTIVKKGKNSLTIACGDGKLIEFSNLKLFGRFKKYLTNFYIKYFINESK